MTCEHFQEQFVEYLLCELSESEERAIEQHLQSGCVACNEEFLAIRDGTELLFSVAPQTELTQVKCDAILAGVLAASTDARSRSKNDVSSPPVVLLAERKRNGRRHALQGLLALVAGFALVLAIPAAGRIEPSSTALDGRVEMGGVEEGNTSGLGVVVPARNARPNFVSFENMTQIAQPKDRSVSGFLLIDTLAGEIHLLGRRLEPALPGAPPLELQIVTASGSVQYPLNFSASGFCKSLVSLPREPIVKIEIVSSSPSSTDTSRSTNSSRVD